MCVCASAMICIRVRLVVNVVVIVCLFTPGVALVLGSCFQY